MQLMQHSQQAQVVLLLYKWIWIWMNLKRLWRDGWNLVILCLFNLNVEINQFNIKNIYLTSLSIKYLMDSQKKWLNCIIFFTWWIFLSKSRYSPNLLPKTDFVLWKIVLNHLVDSWKVKTSGANVCAYQNSVLSFKYLF